MTDFTQAADLLTRLNRWRTGGRGEMPDPRDSTAAINTAILALRIAQAAKEWREAEQAKASAKRRFADAVSACVDDHASALAYEQTGRLKTVWLIVRVRTDYPYEHEWVYADGSDASDDPRAIENQAAYQALKEARKVAGIKRAVLTRMIGRLTK